MVRNIGKDKIEEVEIFKMLVKRIEMVKVGNCCRVCDFGTKNEELLRTVKDEFENVKSRFDYLQNGW